MKRPCRNIPRFSSPGTRCSSSGHGLGLPAGPQPDGPRARAAVDAVYEAALRITLQLLVLD